MLNFISTKTVAVGEAMIEMAVTEVGRYRRSFAGDTFNTAWHMSQISGANLPVGFVTKVGNDAVSADFITQAQQDGIETSGIARDLARTMGLYMIELNGTERSFQYWRDLSAARLLAEDESWLSGALSGAGLVHVSGITLAIVGPDARARLISALRAAREEGARVSFDPNVRPRLWATSDETREAMSAMFTVTDIAVPSFDDEAGLWGDGSPQETVNRLHGFGIPEIAIKNGADPVTVCTDGQLAQVVTPAVKGIRDTSGAGDAFNAGYLAARLLGHAPDQSITAGQTMSAAVLQHFGARIPKGQVPSAIDLFK